MNTAFTNRIRAAIDALPVSIRDARWFMWPFFFVWFRGKNVRTLMDLKRLAPAMSESEFREVYRRLTTLGDSRQSDTNDEAMQFVLSRLDRSARSLLDVGTGRGFFLSKLSGMTLVGTDIVEPVPGSRVTGHGPRFVMAGAERLPFKDRAFDVVTCFHTLEHVRDLAAAAAELKRVARSQLIVIVPRQRYFYYTLDLHLHFFPTAGALGAVMGGGGEVHQFGSDLVYISAP